MYPFDVNFEGKLFFITMLAGVSLFCYYLMETYDKTKGDFKKWKENYFKNEYPKVKAETNRILRDMKQKIFGKVMCGHNILELIK